MTKAIVEKIQAIRNRKTRIVFFREISLMMAMFFLPFGYDALFKLVMDLTGSYWGADIVFYGISGSFWLAFILLTRYLNKNKID